jgi:hypothetical protein
VAANPALADLDLDTPKGLAQFLLDGTHTNTDGTAAYAYSISPVTPQSEAGTQTTARGKHTSVHSKPLAAFLADLDMPVYDLRQIPPACRYFKQEHYTEGISFKPRPSDTVCCMPSRVLYDTGCNVCDDPLHVLR